MTSEVPHDLSPTDGDLQSRYLAAIDLGSNSFHMIIAEEMEHGNIRVIDRVKEMVRLNAGLDEQGFLSEEAQQRALACLSRFRQRLTTIPYDRIRAAGTNTLRVARNGEAFLLAAERALGHRISIISGHEEARLVYLGAAFDLTSTGKQRLVVDIGGSSTELTIGQGYQPVQMDSLYMGCVSLSRQFFPDGLLTASGMENIKRLALRELEPLISTYTKMGWQEVVGTSGTIKAVDYVSRALGLDQDWISRESFTLIDEWIRTCHHYEDLEHVSEQRRPVFVGGFMILSTIFEVLNIERMDISEGALREGVLYDLIGRLHDEDSRHLGVKSLISHFNTDQEQSRRVNVTSSYLFEQVAQDWGFDDPVHSKLLGWASQLHEIGIAIAYSQYHKHGAYVIENSDIDGFSRQLQRVLALLVRSHRQKIPHDLFKALPREWEIKALRLAILLRLSVAFHRSRADLDLRDVRLEVDDKAIVLYLPNSWIAHHPLTLFDLETEQGYLETASHTLEVKIR